MSLRHKLAIPLVIILAIVLFSGQGPAISTGTSAINKAQVSEIFSGITLFKEEQQIQRFGIIPNLVSNKGMDCIPKYDSSVFSRNGNCFTEVEVGPVVIHRGLYKVSNGTQCSYLLSVAVRSALRSDIYSSCANGDFI